MKRPVSIPVLFCIFLLIFGPSGACAEPDIEIYTHFRPEMFGTALDRSDVLGFSFDVFRDSPTMNVPGDGIATMVTFSAVVRAQLLDILEDGERLLRDGVEVSRFKKAGVDMFSLRYIPGDMEFSFSLEQPSGEMYDVIDRVYGGRPDVASEVKTHYADNFIVRIHAAEDFLESGNGRIDFEEALVAASVIGEPFQHLLGIRNGRNLLGNLGYIAMEQVYSRSGGVLYRPFRGDGEGIHQFLFKLQGMSGDTVENLYKLTAAAYRFEKHDGRIELPEVFVEDMTGDSFDLAFFYYDMFRRLGMEAKILSIRDQETGGGVTGAVVFREDRQWRFIDEEGIDIHSLDGWTRLPAVAYGETVRYIELDPEEILETGTYPASDAGGWIRSVY